MIDHQLKIAQKTLKLSDIGAELLGGMTKAEAQKIVDKNKKKAGLSFSEEVSDAN